MPPEDPDRKKEVGNGSSAELQSQPQAWLRARARLMPDLLPKSPPWVRGVFDHAWAPMQALADEVGDLPDELWAFLMGYPGGFAYVTTGESRYVPGPAGPGGQMLNVAYVSVADLAEDNDRPLHTLGHLVDHHLGCGGALEGSWLSDGGGLTAQWQQAGARLGPLFDLGYAADEVAQTNLRDYFAQSLALYCRDPQRLNVADPQIDKWFRTTLWNPGFW